MLSQSLAGESARLAPVQRIHNIIAEKSPSSRTALGFNMFKEKNQTEQDFRDLTI